MACLPPTMDHVCRSCPRSRSPPVCSTAHSRAREIESALAPGINALKTFDPPLSALAGQKIDGRRPAGQAADREDRRAGRAAGAADPPDVRRAPAAVRQARRPARPHLAAARADRRRARAAPARVRLQAGRLGEAAARRASSTRTRRSRRSAPKRGRPAGAIWASCWTRRGPLHALLRDQRTIAGIGRSWVDEILWEAKLSPYKRGADLDAEELARLREAIVRRSTRAIDHYEEVVTLPIPDKLPMPLRVHRHEGEPCPRCGTTLRGGPLRGLRDRLLPRLSDRRADAEGPADVEAAEVGGRSSQTDDEGKQNDRTGDKGTRLRAARPGRPRGEAFGFSWAAGRRVFLSKGRNPRLYRPGLRRARPSGRLRQGGRSRARDLPGPCREGQEVPRQGGAELRAARRRGPRGGRTLRRLGAKKSMYGKTYMGASARRS